MRGAATPASSDREDIVYSARLMDAAEAKALHIVNEVVARGAVLDRAVAIAEQASAYNAQILRLGRDLYHNMRNLTPAQALEETRFALVAALGAEDETRSADAVVTSRASRRRPAAPRR